MSSIISSPNQQFLSNNTENINLYSFLTMNVPELKNTHFFFSSMLSGQRALDIGSRERLLWQIKRVFNASQKTLLKIKPQNKIEFNKKHR